MERSDKVQICKVVAQAILADGQITDSEHHFLTDLMTVYELSEEEKKDVMERNVGDNASDMAAEIEGYESKNELMVELAMAVAADGELSSSERELLGQVASALGVDDADIEMLVKTALM